MPERIAGTVPLQSDDILVVTQKSWDRPKRIAHKMPLAWAEAGNRVLWLEQPPFPLKDWRKPGQLGRSLRGHLEQVHERLWVGASPPALPGMHRGGVRGHLARELHRPAMLGRIRRYTDELGFKPRIVVLMQLPARYDLLGAFSGATSVYYCHDLIGYGSATASLLAEEAEACRQVNQVWTTSEPLRRRLAGYNRHTYTIPHAVDERWWDCHRGEAPAEYQGIPPPRVVFTGVVETEKVDLALLGEVARLRPKMHFVLVGPLQVRTCDHPALERAQRIPNIHFLGERDVERLPGYVAGAQALMLPYRLDYANAGYIGLSLKFYEYLISGRPVCATPYSYFEEEVDDLIEVAEGAGEWAKTLDRVVSLVDPGLARRREEVARQNTYRQRLELQRALLTGGNSIAHHAS